MPSCGDCIYNLVNQNYCLVYKLPPANARRYDHMCGPRAVNFRMIPPPPKDLAKRYPYSDVEKDKQNDNIEYSPNQ